MDYKNIQKDIKCLLLPPTNASVDHIHILQQLYECYTEGATFLQPIMNYYLNGIIEQIPSLKEQHLWNPLAFQKARKPFIESHGELVKIIQNKNLI